MDLLTNDLGLVVICDDAGQLLGFNAYVGGGMGRWGGRSMRRRGQAGGRARLCA